ncbi:MAG TPA: sigma-70 family RNA polymerase sigma factor [Polyangiaceae bacterium]|nr:sigma-70 family RNA polymerase sigma factor [Polyangiaceae bacterium]
MIEAEARGAWHELQRHLRPYVARRLASSADVDDLVQEILLRLHQGGDALRDSESFGGWVYRVAQSTIVDRVRAERRQPRVAIADAGDLSDTDAGQEQAADALRSHMTRCLALFVSQLVSPYREAITLTELQGLTHRQAAEVLGISLTAMKSRVQRGRDKLRSMFEECCSISSDARGRVVACDPHARSC